MLRAILVRAQKGAVVDKAQIPLETVSSVVDWSGGANRAVKAIVMRPQIEMIGALLGAGGKAISITVWQRTWINRGHSLVLVESRSRER